MKSCESGTCIHQNIHLPLAIEAILPNNRLSLLIFPHFQVSFALQTGNMNIHVSTESMTQAQLKMTDPNF